MANRLRYKVFEREGNPFWPLPPDYADLNHDSKRLARLNAVRMQGNPELAVCSWQFFCDYYLKPKYNADGSVLFDPIIAPLGINPEDHQRTFEAFRADAFQF